MRCEDHLGVVAEPRSGRDAERHRRPGVHGFDEGDVGEAVPHRTLGGTDGVDGGRVVPAEQHCIGDTRRVPGVGLVEQVVAGDGRVGREGARQCRPCAHQLGLNTVPVDPEVGEGLSDCRRQLADWHDLHLAVLFPPTFQLEPDEILANHRGLIETFAA